MVGDRQIPTPLASMFEAAVPELQYRYGYEDGAEWAGGFFIIPNVQMHPDAPGMFVDLLLLAYGDQMNADRMAVLKQYNLTGALADAPVVCCYETSDLGVGIKDAVSGIARVLVYETDPATAEVDVQRVTALYEGTGAGGDPTGFGRLITDNYSSDPPMNDLFVGYLSDAESAAGKYVYFRDMEYLYSGSKVGEYRNGPPDQEYEFDSFVIESGVDEAALYRRSRARAQAEAFGNVASQHILAFPKYNWLHNTVDDEPGAIYKYMTNASLGGGELGLTFQVGNQEIESPMYDIWETATAELADRYEQGEMTAGGFFVLLNIQEMPGSDMFYDAALYAYGSEHTAAYHDALLNLNATGEALNSTDPVCCWFEDEDRTPGISQLVSGVARLVYY